MSALKFSRSASVPQYPLQWRRYELDKLCCGKNSATCRKKSFLKASGPRRERKSAFLMVCSFLLIGIIGLQGCRNPYIQTKANRNQGLCLNKLEYTCLIVASDQYRQAWQWLPAAILWLQPEKLIHRHLHSLHRGPLERLWGHGPHQADCNAAWSLHRSVKLAARNWWQESCLQSKAGIWCP